MLATTLTVGWFLLYADSFHSLCRQTWAVLLLGGNFYFYNTLDYFFSKIENPLLHCWSLAVEVHMHAVHTLHACMQACMHAVHALHGYLA